MKFRKKIIFLSCNRDLNKLRKYIAKKYKQEKHFSFAEAYFIYGILIKNGQHVLLSGSNPNGKYYINVKKDVFNEYQYDILSS